MAIRAYPVGKTQKMVLDALNLTADDFDQANRIFDELGLVVTSERQGRATIPVVEVLPRERGAFNAYGEGVETEPYPEIDTAALEQWIK